MHSGGTADGARPNRLLACPRNAQVVARAEYPVPVDTMDDGPELLPLAAGDGGYFERAMPTFSRRAGLDAIRGNAIVALGNARDPVAVETLAETIRLEDPRLRAYSAWALGRIGGARAAALLDQATTAETDPVVAAEIDRASVRHP